MQILNLEKIGRFRCPKCNHYMSDKENICSKCHSEISQEKKKKLLDMEFNLSQQINEETEEQEFKSKSTIYVWSAIWASLFIFTQILGFSRIKIGFIVVAVIAVVYGLVVFIRNRSRE